ncbi:outer membrane protein assembly factor BamB family protein [Streptacidiphilus cavernicola]|uniref:PQQ-binding-like beta-propeller repeat protein n=1 Tax=Streptacidiphilus cavernicola TaxID=3342716 RepID=A0ABV6VZP0_9ACTN
MEPSSLSWSWPTAVYLDGDTLLVGTPADRHKRVQPANYRTEFKRNLGQETPIRLGDREFSPVLLVTEVLRALRVEAERVYGRGPISRVVLTIPTSYDGDHSRRWGLMIEAGEAAGFSAVELIFEPVAAALEPPAGDPFAAGDLVLVYDFGGGTFDAALVRYGAGGGSQRVLGHRTLDDCGGMDIDAAVWEWLHDHGPDRLAALLTADPAAGSDAALAAFRARVQLATLGAQMKIQLTDRPTAVELFDQMLELRLDLETFTKFTEPIVARTIRCCVDLLAAADVQREELAAVLLVGGSSRIPMVAAALEREFARPVRQSGAPQYAVLHGAARFAATARQRFVRQSAEDPGLRAVRWSLPGDTATLLRWQVGPGEAYAAGADVAEVRLTSGAILGLRAEESGTVRGLHARPGETVESGDWLLTAERGFRPWRTGIHGVFGTPAILGRTVVTASGPGRVDARVAATGEPRWRYDAGSELTTAPVAADGCVYLGGRDGRLHALDAATGAPRWSVRYQAGDAVCTVPSLAQGLLCFGAEDRHLHLLDAGTGAVRLRIPVQARVRGAVLRDGTVHAVLGDGRLVALDAATGKQKWSVAGAVSRTPLVAEGSVFACFADGTLRRLDADLGHDLWQPPPTTESSDGGFRGRLARVLPTSPPLLAAEPEATGGVRTVLLATGDGQVSAFAVDSGALAWRRRVGGPGARSLAVSDGVVYLGSSDHRLYATEAVGATGVRSFATGGGIESAAAVADGAVHVVSEDGYLYALAAVTLAGPEPRAHQGGVRHA